MQIKFISFLVLFCFLGLECFSQSTNTRKWRRGENDSLEAALIMLDEGRYLEALPIYEKLYNSHSNEEFLAYCYGKCALYRSDRHDMAFKLLGQVYENNKKAVDIDYDFGRACHYNYKFDEAIALFDRCISNKKTDAAIRKNAIFLKQNCMNAKWYFEHPSDVKIENIGNVINTENDEYVPLISADESLMIFTYNGVKSNGGLQNDALIQDEHGKYFEDVFQSTKVNGEWTAPQPILSINTNSHDGAVALSADGQYLFVNRDNGSDRGDIYMSNSLNGEWTLPQKLNGDVNSYSWEGSCSLTADGKHLYFSSERSGGYGGKDIYKATLMPDKSWGNVVNLGDSINTAFDDDAPFIHPDGTTLFYSSKGKGSMGGYDIFQSQFNWKDSTYSSPINLGYPINTPDDDIYYVLSANAEHGYYSSGKSTGKGLNDIYTVTPGYVGKKPSTYLVKGTISEGDSVVIASILVETKSGNRKFGEFFNNALTGHYLITLPAGDDFIVTYAYGNFPKKTLDINTKNLSGYAEKIVNVNFNMGDTLAPIAKRDTFCAIIKNTDPVKPSKIAEKTVVVNQVKLVPNNNLQAKTKELALKYGDLEVKGLQFKVQIAAYKYPKNYNYTHLKQLGAIEKLVLEDGITRITIGGNFTTLLKALQHADKVMQAGQKDAFVTILYNGKRIFLEDLEKMEEFKGK
jgi:hypothetical protein